MDHFGVDPKYVLGIGDNLHGDVEALVEAGAVNVVWIPSNWIVYQQGNLAQLPSGVIKVENIAQVIPKLISQ